MRIDLGARRSRGLFLVAVVGVAALLAFFAGKAWLAEHWNDSAEPALWRKAALVEPADARYWEHLGRYEQWNLNQDEPGRAAEDFRRAAEADPSSARCWMELAGAYQSLGRPDRARQAYERARTDEPLSPKVAWRYGGFLLRQRDFAAGYEELRRALLSDPSLAGSAVSECWQAGANVGQILGHVLPPKSGGYLAAIDFFLSQRRFDPALAVWRRLLALGQPLAMERTLPLIDGLIGANRLSDAGQVWRQALAAGWLAGEEPGPSLVFNGGFEHPLVDGAFGWRETPVAGAAFALDRSVARSGSECLRITFDGSANLDFRNLVQYVRVQPGSRYRFSAFLRTENISTDSGVRFLLFDARHPSALEVLTPAVVGTHAWENVSAEIATGNETDLLGIALRRLPSEKFDNKLAGSVWVDDVSLAPAGKTAKRGGK